MKRSIVIQKDMTVDVPNRRRYGEWLRAGTITATDRVTAAEAVRQAAARELEPPAEREDKD